MTKSGEPEYTLKEFVTVKSILIIFGILFVIYLIGLFNPLTGPWFQYPYYKIGCGKDPITASSFKIKTYHTPDMKTYPSTIRTASAIFCTEEEALKAGYQRSVAQ